MRSIFKVLLLIIIVSVIGVGCELSSPSGNDGEDSGSSGGDSSSSGSGGSGSSGSGISNAGSTRNNAALVTKEVVPKTEVLGQPHKIV